MSEREKRIQSALSVYENSPWGRAIADPEQARGLCKRASLVLLELLRRQGIEDAELWHLGAPKEGSGFAPGDEHYVVVIGADAIDATARQFNASSDAITRRPLNEIDAPWRSAQPVRIGHIDPLFGRDLHDIPKNWPALADVGPPGDAIGWEFPDPRPTSRSDG
jgi:hypothetical protein